VELLKMKKLLVVVLFACAGCFSPNEPTCSFACADSDPKCPLDYTCLSDGYCHLQGDTASCGFSDASVPLDMATKPPAGG
jgi:hypothetical protein